MDQRLKALLIGGLLGFAVGNVYAETPQEWFKKGNEAYAAKKFDDAISAYQSAVDGGLRHWVVYFNLSDAHFRAGHLGKAMVNVDRAFQLNSSNSDVLDNLVLLSTKAGDPRMPTGALPALLWRLFYKIGLNGLTVLTSLLFAVLAGFSMGPWLGRWRMPSQVMIGTGIAFAVFATWLGARIYVHHEPLAVVITPNAEVRSGPALSDPASFTVPEGRRVEVLADQEPVSGWLEVGVPQEGLKGWVPDSSVERL